MPAKRPARRQNAKELAYEHLRATIAEMHLPEGQFLREEDVAAELGISRTPVREAFLRLQAESLLQLVPNKGAFVPPITERETEQLIECRDLLETHAAPAVIRNASERLEDALAENLSQQRQCLESDDIRGYVDTDQRFHLELVAATGNDVLTSLYNSLRTRQTRMALNVARQWPSQRFVEVLDEHQAVLDALRQRDVKALRAALRAHSDATLAAGRDASATWRRHVDDDRANSKRAQRR
jgi:DNA-binding GntR family transcriptional regulator